MNWEAFLGTAAIASIIVFLQWPTMKQRTKKDQFTLIGILMIGLLLSMFHLEQMKAAVTFREELFKPFERYMQKKQL